MLPSASRIEGRRHFRTKRREHTLRKHRVRRTPSRTRVGGPSHGGVTCGRHGRLPVLMLAFFNPLNPELNPICYLLALLAHHFLRVSRIRVKSLTLRLLMSYIYMERLILMFLDHTQRRSTVGRTPLDE